MKIDQSLPLIQNGIAGKKRSRESSGAGFEQALTEASNKSRSGSVTGSVAAAALSSLTGALAAAQAGPAAQIDRGLKALDQYGRALSDPSITLKQIEPMVGSLEKLADDLDRLEQGLPEGHGLKGVAKDAAVLMQVEAAKFRRGDYV